MVGVGIHMVEDKKLERGSYSQIERESIAYVYITVNEL